jgi:hypothetical protein
MRTLTLVVSICLAAPVAYAQHKPPTPTPTPAAKPALPPTPAPASQPAAPAAGAPAPLAMPPAPASQPATPPAPVAPPAPPASPADRPWAKNVSDQDQSAALDLLRDGNNLVGQMLFPNAVSKYEEALKHWDHPSIHYNLALALYAVGDQVGVHENIVEALKYGEAPFPDHAKFLSAQDYLKKSEEQLSHLFVSCELAGAQVAMDGSNLFSGPGKWDGWVKPGRHAISATATGYLSATDNRDLPAGKDTDIKLKMVSAANATVYVRKFPVWKVYTVLGGGVLLAGIGGIFHASAAGGFSSYDEAIAACDKTTNHMCKPSSDIASKEKTARAEQVVGFVGYGLGIATLAMGAYLMYVDRPIAVENNANNNGSLPISVVPSIGPGGANVSLTVKF